MNQLSCLEPSITEKKQILKPKNCSLSSSDFLNSFRGSNGSLCFPLDCLKGRDWRSSKRCLALLLALSVRGRQNLLSSHSKLQMHTATNLVNVWAYESPASSFSTHFHQPLSLEKWRVRPHSNPGLEALTPDAHLRFNTCNPSSFGGTNQPWPTKPQKFLVACSKGRVCSFTNWLGCSTRPTMSLGLCWYFSTNTCH